MDSYGSSETTPIPHYCNYTYFRLSSFIIIGIIAPIFIVFGIVANSLVIKVLSGPTFRYPTTVILIALAVMDILLPLCTLLTSTAAEWLAYTEYVAGHHVHTHIMHFLYPLGRAARTACIYLTVAAVFERLLDVACPAGCRCRCGRRCACALAALAAAYAALFNAAHFYSYGVRTSGCPGGTWNAQYVASASFHMELAEDVADALWPFAALCAMCVLVVVGRRRRARSWAHADRTKDNTAAAALDRQLTAMALGAASLWLLCYLPTVAMTLADVLSIYIRSGEARAIAAGVSQLLEMISSSAKLPVYWALSAEFRRRMCHKDEQSAAEA